MTRVVRVEEKAETDEEEEEEEEEEEAKATTRNHIFDTVRPHILPRLSNFYRP